jgi:hypothetical protein
MWGVDLPRGDKRQAADTLLSVMRQRTALLEIVESLEPASERALSDLLTHGGRTPLADFQRRHGSIREMGPGRRDREKPWRSPNSATEALWYRGLIGRAFIDSPTGPQEHVFIPMDLQAVMPETAAADLQPLGDEANPPPVELHATSAVVDDATTLLAALRKDPLGSPRGIEQRRSAYAPSFRQPDSMLMLFTLLREAEVLQARPITPEPSRVRTFLDLPRGEALSRLLLTWRDSTSWNELSHTPGLIHEADAWPNDPLQTRHAVMDFVGSLPPKTWWDVETFIDDIKQRRPSFQRPAGDFDSWYLRQRADGQFLRGFEHWEEVEGRLLRYILSGPMHWLGAIDLGRVDETSPFCSFRLTEFAEVLRDQDLERLTLEENEQVTLQADGKAIVPLGVPRSLRYQIARFSVWGGLDKRGYRYQLTPRALEQASSQGLEARHIMAVLEKASGGPVPAPIRRALLRWDAHGTEAELQARLLLEVREADVLRELLGDRRTARYISEQLDETHALVLDKNWPRLQEAAARLGLLIEPPPGSE